MRLVLASGNTGKLRELASWLAPLGFQLEVQSALGVQAAAETGVTFADNALLKARHAAAMTGLAALADDSGIEVDALGGRPGVFSARYAGEGATDVENVRKLLQALRDVPSGRRTARYRCVIAFVRSAQDPSPLLAEGVWDGTVAHEPRGLAGFGYDPIFIPEGLHRTAAELDPAEKQALSHRTQALRALVARLGSQSA